MLDLRAKCAAGRVDRMPGAGLGSPGGSVNLLLSHQVMSLESSLAWRWTNESKNKPNLILTLQLLDKIVSMLTRTGLVMGLEK